MTNQPDKDAPPVDVPAQTVEGAASAPVDPITGLPAPKAGEPPKLQWYVVHTYSGHENRAKLSLIDRVKNANLNDYFGDVLIPTESVMEVVKGQRRTSTRKFYPGYMFVQMALNERTFHLVKGTPKITLPKTPPAGSGRGIPPPPGGRPTPGKKPG
jgi:hypothetical protein